MYSEGNTFGLPYDYESVMHYPFTAFAVDKTLPTLVPKTRHARIGQNKNLSPLDVAKIQVAYRCGPVDVSSLDIEPLSTSTESVRGECPVARTKDCTQQNGIFAVRRHDASRNICNAQFPSGHFSSCSSSTPCDAWTPSVLKSLADNFSMIRMAGSLESSTGNTQFAGRKTSQKQK